jgi:hypothetical protein
MGYWGEYVDTVDGESNAISTFGDLMGEKSENAAYLDRENALVRHQLPPASPAPCCIHYSGHVQVDYAVQTPHCVSCSNPLSDT